MQDIIKREVFLVRSNKKKRHKKIIELISKKRILIPSLLVALVLIFNFLILPPVVRSITYDILRDHNIRSVGINRLKCNILAASCRVGPLSLFKDPANKLVIRRLSVDIDVLKLPLGIVNISGLKLSGAYIKLDKVQGKTLISGIDPSGFSSEEESSHNKQEEEESKNSGASFIFGASNVEIENSIIIYSDTEHNSRAETSIREISMQDYTPWQNDVLTRLTFYLDVNKIDLLAFINANISKEQVDVAGKTMFANISAKNLQKLLGGKKIFSVFDKSRKTMISRLDQDFLMKFDRSAGAKEIILDARSKFSDVVVSLPPKKATSGAVIKSPLMDIEVKNFRHDISLKKTSFENIGVVRPFDITLNDTLNNKEVSINMHVSEMFIGAADSSKSNEETPVKLVAKVSENSKVVADGWVKPFAEKLAVDGGVNFSNIDLMNYSPYIENAAGIALKKGKGNVKAKAKITSGDLDSKINIRIQGLGLESPKKAAGDDQGNFIEKQIGMPLRSAVGLLQDADGNIDLDIPVKGDPSSPEFDIGDIISTALQSAVISAVKLTLDIMFPPSMILYFAISESKSFGLKPIEFRVAKHRLSSDQKKYLDSINELLNKRPKLVINFCPVNTRPEILEYADERNVDEDEIIPFFTSDEADNNKLKEKGSYIWQRSYADLERMSESVRADLKNINDRRFESIKNYLVTKDKTLSDRISPCLTETDIDSKKLPYMEVTW